MKKIAITAFVFLFTTKAFSQQFLWSTSNTPGIKHVSLENVTEKVLEFYDHYKFYHDATGFSKAGFFKNLENSATFKQSDDSVWKALKDKINKTDSLTVFAFKANLGQGSSVLILCIGKENVDMVGFSNNVESDAQLTSSYERTKFTKWFKTLLQ